MALMLSCRDFDEFIADYLDNKLSFWQKLSFKLHYISCPLCKKYLKEYIASREAGKNMFERLDDELPHEVPEDLVQAILAARK